MLPFALIVLDILGQYPKPGDEKLLGYLWNHKHTTPFEMAGLTIEVQAPIFVFREWHRHRTQSYNEMSGRYVVLPDLYYVPSLDRIQKQSQTNKQSSGEPFNVDAQLAIQDVIRAEHLHTRTTYEALIQTGLAKEIARWFCLSHSILVCGLLRIYGIGYIS